MDTPDTDGPGPADGSAPPVLPPDLLAANDQVRSMRAEIRSMEQRMAADGGALNPITVVNTHLMVLVDMLLPPGWVHADGSAVEAVPSPEALESLCISNPGRLQYEVQVLSVLKSLIGQASSELARAKLTMNAPVPPPKGNIFRP